MGKKKKGKKAQAVSACEEESEAYATVSNELEVLRSIYGDHFSVLEDGMGCRLHLVPHPAEIDEVQNVSVALEARCAR
jgi:hypothetical protein